MVLILCWSTLKFKPYNFFRLTACCISRYWFYSSLETKRIYGTVVLPNLVLSMTNACIYLALILVAFPDHFVHAGFNRYLRGIDPLHWIRSFGNHRHFRVLWREEALAEIQIVKMFCIYLFMFKNKKTTISILAYRETISTCATHHTN